MGQVFSSPTKTTQIVPTPPSSPTSVTDQHTQPQGTKLPPKPSQLFNTESEHYFDPDLLPLKLRPPSSSSTSSSLLNNISSVLPFVKNFSFRQRRKEKLQKRQQQHQQQKETKEEDTEISGLRTWNFNQWDESDNNNNNKLQAKNNKQLIFKINQVEESKESKESPESPESQALQKSIDKTNQEIRDLVDIETKLRPTNVPFLEKERLQRREKIYAHNILMLHYKKTQLERYRKQLAKYHHLESIREAAYIKIHKQNAMFVKTLSKAATNEEAHLQQQLHSMPWGQITKKETILI